jgi:hypothetical protein
MVELGYDCVSADKQELAKDLDERLDQYSALAHSSMAKVALAAADFDEIEGWGSPGIRSFTHWLSINMGFDPHTGSELLRVGQALKKLPRIAEAFGAGHLSFDKARQITSVATPATEEMLLEIARGASGSQLARICSSLRRYAEAEAIDHDQRQMASRGLWSHIDDDGMMRLIAKLPAEDGAVVMAALESITGSKSPANSADAEVKDPADEPWAARRADALVAMSNHVLAGGAADLVKSAASRQVMVHVDVGVLTGEETDGRIFVEGGAPLSREAARRIGCDCQIVHVIERDGLPIDVGRARRTISAPLRRAIEVRDRFCRFPGCGVPAHRAEGHHVVHWADGGATERDNIILMCLFHHHRLHEGAFQVVTTAGGGFTFETSDGHVIGERNLIAPQTQPSFPLETARSTWGGARMDFDHLMCVLPHSMELAEARAAPPNSS